MRLIRHIAVAFASSIALSACGGSGGHDDAPQVSLAVPSTSLSPIAETRATPPATTAASFAPSSSAEPMAFEGLSLSYLASFPSGSLAPALDRLGFGALQRGDTLVPGSDPAWRPVHGEIELAITRPVGYLGGLVASSLSATPVDFAIGSKVGLRATFIAPKGHHDADSIWPSSSRPGPAQPTIPARPSAQARVSKSAVRRRASLHRVPPHHRGSQSSRRKSMIGSSIPRIPSPLRSSSSSTEFWGSRPPRSR